MLRSMTGQACAVCKHQRRRCSSECPLAPYFPPDQPKMFQKAHRLFGVRNIWKILKNLSTEQKAEAMRSIIYQAEIRDRYPVHGCWGVICLLRYQIWQAEEELHAVHAQLEIYRQQCHQQVSSMTDDVPSQLALGMAPPDAFSLSNRTPEPYNAVATLPLSEQHSYSSNSYDSPDMDTKDNSIANTFLVQHPYATDNHHENHMAIPSQLVASQPLVIRQEVVEEYNEMHSFFDIADDRQSFMDSKDAYESR